MALVVDDPTHFSIWIWFAYSFTGLFREAVRYTTPRLKKDRTSIEWKRGSLGLQPSASQYHSGCNSCKSGRPQHLITASFSQKCSNFPDTVTACCIMLDITAGVWHVSDWYCKWIHCSLLPSPVFANKRTMVNPGHKCPLRLTDMSLASPGYSQAFCSGLGDCAVCWAVMQHWDFF